MTLAWSPVDGFSGLSRLRLMGALHADDPDAREDAAVLVRAILERRGFPADDIPEDRLGWAMGSGWVRWRGMKADLFFYRSGVMTKWHAADRYAVTLCGLLIRNRSEAEGSMMIPTRRICKSCLRAWNRYLFGGDR